MMKRGSGTAVDFHHTFTEPRAQGRGVAAKLVTAGLEWAVSHKYAVIPTCSYVAAFIEKNPRFKSSL
jgi:predicted GNAT family acetyltransferase